MLLKVSSTLAFIIFGGFAAVQYNDPDAWLWMMIYGYAATLAVFLLLRRPVLIPAILGFLVYLVGLIWTAPTFDAQWFQSETAREGGGLIICMLWMVACGIWGQSRD